MIEKDWKIYHITWVTHDSRVSERMIEHKVKKGKPVFLSLTEEIEVAQYLSNIITEDNLRVAEFNICRNHVHLLLVCEEKDKCDIVRKLKGKVTQLYKQNHKIVESFSLWAQKYNDTWIDSEERLLNTIDYIRHNREKHGLPSNKGLQPLVERCRTPLENLFEPVILKV